MSSFYSIAELAKLGLAKIGKNVLISRYARIYNPQNLMIGNNVRIDDFSIISVGNNAKIKLYDYVHIAAQACLWGHKNIFLGRHVGISSGCKLYTESDDFSGKTLTGPTVPLEFKTNMTSGNIIVGDHTIIGANSIILPNITIGKGCAFGSNSFINKNCNGWTIYAGIPAKPIGLRQSGLLGQAEILEKIENNIH